MDTENMAFVKSVTIEFNQDAVEKARAQLQPLTNGQYVPPAPSTAYSTFGENLISSTRMNDYNQGGGFRKIAPKSSSFDFDSASLNEPIQTKRKIGLDSELLPKKKKKKLPAQEKEPASSFIDTTTTTEDLQRTAPDEFFNAFM